MGQLAPRAPNPEVLAIARARIQGLLTSTDAFRKLPPEQRKELAHNMVKIATYIAAGERGDSTPNVAQFSSGLAGAPSRTVQQQPAPVRTDTASQDMKDSGAAATREAVSAFADAVRQVDFPKFVSDLVHGVFAAIVDSSIKQMQAYADLVKNVAKSVDEYMKDNVTENQARDYLVDQYPNHLELDLGSDRPSVVPKQGVDESTMPNFFADLGLPSPMGGMGSVDGETIENQLVPAARRRLAMDRQQMLATMVLMGVNRLIVTDGSLKASVMFDFKAKDISTRRRATHVDTNLTSTTNTRSHPGIFGWFSGYTSSDNTTEFTVQSAHDTNAMSTSSVESRNNLAGEVNLRFRSETFPLDKMAEMIQPDLRAKIQGNTPAGAAAPQAPGAPPPPPPALPPLPPIGSSPR
ncbi:hypothetical protein [Pendulispora albinea]|uniref:Uncharacterized protein n=1 Tax=Pendulispora albinea TaxID=2741071 RepID=A0ABZ2M0I4_9BACT